uniref:Zinc finger and BTB domain containing 10 n=1 Tax=Hippocampus comes TaxID=109280 RepID=A0A3Q3DM84_HIPCM
MRSMRKMGAALHTQKPPLALHSTPISPSSRRPPPVPPPPPPPPPPVEVHCGEESRCHSTSKMSGERNRRSLAFRGGGLAGLTGSGGGGGGGNGNSWEAPACHDRHFNGNRPDQDDDGDLGATGPTRKRREGAGSVSDSTELDAEEEEDAEGAAGSRGGDADSAANGYKEAGSGDLAESGSAEAGPRKCGVEMRPQTLLQKHSLFHASWLHEFPWLRFCQQTGLMSCSWCREAATRSSDELTKGSRSYKRALLLRHHLSSEPLDNASPSTNSSEDDYRNKPNENSYCYQLLQELDKQRKSGILCDVNIVVSGQVFRAHKNILVAGSRYFKTLYCLTQSEAQDRATVTHLDVAAVQGFSVILDFLYSGNLLLTSQNAIEVMSVASYLQMTEVVQSCRAFIKDALNISIKQEAPDSVVVDYNKRQTVTKEGPRGHADRKPGNFWATSILSKLSIQASGNSQGKDGRRKKQAATRRFVYNFPPEPEEGFDEGMFVQPSASYPREDFSALSENAGKAHIGTLKMAALCTQKRGSRLPSDKPLTSPFFFFWSCFYVSLSLLSSYPQTPPPSFPELANQIQYSIIQPGESWENGESSLLAINKLKCPHCNYIAKHRRTLKRHLVIHSGVRSFSCDICGKLFTRREHVKRHSLVHKKDKKYKCMVCKKIFMLAASVGIRHGSRRYGVCVDCADSHQAGQEGLEGMEFPRDDDFEGDDADDLLEADNDSADHDRSKYETSHHCRDIAEYWTNGAALIVML